MEGYQEGSMLSSKNQIREALITAALFGSVGAAVTPACADSRGATSVQSPKVSGDGRKDAAVATQAAAPALFPHVTRDVARRAG
jgi:hypothetical protein